MILIGLTGGIGSGKSTVSALLEARGAVVIDADRITRDLQQPGEQVLRDMVAHFGEAILLPDGSLDRAKLAARVFSDPDELAALNCIVHPAVGAEIARRLEAQADTENLVVLDVPLLVEAGRDDLAALVVVDVEPDLAVERLVSQRGMAAEDARARMRHQATRSDRLARADLVIDNHGSLADLERQVDAALAWMHERHAPA
jgi:dephospho-CoA kinase